MDEIDVRDSDFQAILDIRPSSVKVLGVEKEDSEFDYMTKLNTNNDLSLYRHFGLPRPEICDDGIRSDINELSRILNERCETPEQMIRMIIKAEDEISRMYPNRRISQLVKYFEEKL